jgi:hypothetical protein
LALMKVIHVESARKTGSNLDVREHRMRVFGLVTGEKQLFLATEKPPNGSPSCLWPAA